MGKNSKNLNYLNMQKGAEVKLRKVEKRHPNGFKDLDFTSNLFFKLNFKRFCVTILHR